MSGRPLGFGIDTQARDDEMGLKSARGRIRTCVEDAIVAVCVFVCYRTQVEEQERQTSLLQRKSLYRGGADLFFDR